MEPSSVNFQLITMIVSILGTVGVGAVFLLLRERNISIRETIKDGFADIKVDLKDLDDEIDELQTKEARLREHLALNYIHKDDYLRSIDRMYQKFDSGMTANKESHGEIHRRLDDLFTVLTKETDDGGH